MLDVVQLKNIPHDHRENRFAYTPHFSGFWIYGLIADNFGIAYGFNNVCKDESFDGGQMTRAPNEYTIYACSMLATLPGLYMSMSMYSIVISADGSTSRSSRSTAFHSGEFGRSSRSPSRCATFAPPITHLSRSARALQRASLTTNHPNMSARTHARTPACSGRLGPQPNTHRAGNHVR